MTAARDLRLPFFLLAVLVILATFALEIGAHWFLPSQAADAAGNVQSQLGIPSLWLLDISLIWTIALMGLALLVNKALLARTQGIVTLVLSIVVILAGLKTLLESFVALIIMIALISTFFGWLVYLPLFGFFNTDAAMLVLSTMTLFKLVAFVLLVFAQQSFVQSKGFVILFALSLLCDLLLAFLIGFPPGVLASVADAIGAIIISIIAIVYAIFQAVWAVVAIVRALV